MDHGNIKGIDFGNKMGLHRFLAHKIRTSFYASLLWNFRPYNKIKISGIKNVIKKKN